MTNLLQTRMDCFNTVKEANDFVKGLAEQGCEHITGTIWEDGSADVYYFAPPTEQEKRMMLKELLVDATQAAVFPNWVCSGAQDLIALAYSMIEE